ncbi:DUF2568 domain-containing protein [Calidifontimicrobium sp. SYSU G02091]|uniref:DUF2568 domain-containing protein n=1 Tax=Calidifontimicrobium sp. SYSU G02091 TaxID=2926421 RepID=UPI001F53127D|nr:DUF2568 domain-containing protein [Calidifontimicrobium sp. SYSU G02091]MCI1192280.1 DUF2568 domain-containing protein [Calidifontimicrobium sp. SYSU G02091]
MNLTLRFLLELAALAALAVWGARAGATPLTAVVLAIAAPLAAAVLWGALVSPKAWVAAGWPVRLGVELAVFGAAVAGLAAAGLPEMAAALAAVVLVHEGWRAAEVRRRAG